MQQNGQLTLWFSRNKLRLLRWTIGLCYLWFGMLKFFPGLSPAEGLAQDTIRALTFGLIPDSLSIILLAIWEVGVGIMLFSGLFLRFGVKAAILHMILTFTPLLFFPDMAFTAAPYAFTIVGQYIVKNLVFLVGLGILLTEDKPAD